MNGQTYTDGGGFERPIDAVFDKAGAMYVVDFGLQDKNKPGGYVPGSGVIWKIARQ